MIRPARESAELSDDEFAELIEPTYQEIKNYLENEFIYEFFANCLSTDFNNDSIWADSNLEYEYRDAIAFLENMPDFKKIDIEKLNKVLKEKHSLKITSVKPIGIEKI